jgi:hypothetical protein
MNWLHDQIYHFNILSIIALVTITTILSKMNLKKEVGYIRDDLYQVADEIKEKLEEATEGLL